MSVAIAFLTRDFLNAASYRIQFLMQFVGILFSAATFYFLSQLIGANVAPQLAEYGGNYFSFVLIGIAFSGYMGLSLSSFSSQIREGQVAGTLELMLLGPTRLSTILISSSLWDLFMVTTRVAAFILVGALLFDTRLDNANVLTTLVVLVLSITSFAGIGILSAAFVLILKKGDPVAWVFGSVTTLLSGVYYPITVLPDWLQPASRFFPLTYALDAIRLGMLQGSSLWQVRTDVFVMMAFSLIFTPAALFVFRKALKRARMEGSLTQY